MKLPVSKLIYMKCNALLFPSASISGFEELKLGSRWNVVVLALLKEESAFPWVTGNGGDGWDRPLQIVLWLGAVTVKMWLKAGDHP